MSAFLAIACGSDDSQAGSAPPPVELRGTVLAARSVTVSAQIDGVVTMIGGAAGAPIAAGATLARLVNPSVDRDAEVTRAQLALIDTHLRRAASPATATRATSRESLDASAKILDLRRDRFETMKKLRATNDVTARDVQQAEAEYVAALRDYRNDRSASSVGAPANADVGLLQLERQKVVAEQTFAAHRRSLLSVAAPFGGTITRFHVAEGQAVYPRDPIADIADLATLQVRAPIAPELLQYVRPGMRVEVKIAGTPPRTIAAKVDSIIPASQAAGAEAGSPAVVVTIPGGADLEPNTKASVTLLPTR